MERTRILRIIAIVLRGLEIASATVVLGITGYFLSTSSASTWDLGRFIYTEVVSGVSVLATILSLILTIDPFFQVPLDLLLSLLWWTVFGLLFNYTGFPCEWVFDWMQVSPSDQQCGKLHAEIAFAFLSAIFWMVSAVANGLISRWEDRQTESDVAEHYRKREMQETSEV